MTLDPRAMRYLEVGRRGHDPTSTDLARNRVIIARRVGAAGVLFSLGSIARSVVGSVSGIHFGMAGLAIVAAAAGAGIAVVSSPATAPSILVAGNGAAAASTFSVAVQSEGAGVPANEAHERRDSPIASPGTPASLHPTGRLALPSGGMGMVNDRVVLPSPGGTSLVDDQHSGQQSGVPATSSSSSSGQLGAEVALLERAHQALRDGDTPSALQALEAHRSQHPTGILGEEREAAYALALCAGGQTDEGRAAALRFEAARPSSPHLSRIRAACGISTPKPTASP